MLRVPAGWTRHVGANLLTIYPPGGGARVRYHERTPPGTFSSVLRRVLGEDPHFRPAHLGTPLRAITAEGEYGAWVAIGGRRKGYECLRCVGAVLTDEFAAAVDGLALLPEKRGLIEATTRELLASAEYGLGVRRRRTMYNAPPGWQALPQGLVATWYPLDYPAHLATITVFPANPDTRPIPLVFEDLLAADAAAGVDVRTGTRAEPFAAQEGLAGQRFRYAARGTGQDAPLLHREVIILGDHRYRYLVRLENACERTLDADLGVFVALAASMQPAPYPGERRLGFSSLAAAASSSHWVE
jgi:hypothetical protein